MKLFGVLYNNCYGGFGISDKAVKEYNKRTKEKKIKDHYDLITKYKSNILLIRIDPLLVDIFNELGSEEFSGKSANVQIEYLPVKYKDSFHIHEYDGMEDVYIDYRRYELKNKDVIDELKKVLYDENKSDSQKVDKMKKLLSEN